MRISIHFTAAETICSSFSTLPPTCYRHTHNDQETDKKDWLPNHLTLAQEQNRRKFWFAQPHSLWDVGMPAIHAKQGDSWRTTTLLWLVASSPKWPFQTNQAASLRSIFPVILTIMGKCTGKVAIIKAGICNLAKWCNSHLFLLASYHLLLQFLIFCNVYWSCASYERG